MSKVVLITGGSSGIGKAIGEFLFHKGFTVYGTSRNPEKVTNSIFPLIALDVRSVDSIHHAVQKIISVSKRIDIVINNAGVGITGPVEETPTAEMRNNFETNFFGPIEVMRAALPQMREQRSGLIINITSIAGYMGLPYRGVYSASKGALEIISEAVSMEVKSFGINITTVAPGDFATNIASGRYHAPVIKGSAYEVPYGATLNEMNSHVDSGSNPDEMAMAIYRIIQEKNPKLHYRVGAFMQKFSIVLKRVLPDRIYESMLMNHYKLK
jgi:NAD(P)-dependent dehydrogenase (short-subunit alcohol dehydrogenase family)